MVEQIFLKILNMSLTSSVVILAVLLARLALRRAPRIFSYALWAVVLFRLLCPVSFSSAFSLLGVMKTEAFVEQGSVVYIPEDIGYEMTPTVHLPISAVNDSVNEILPPGNPAGSANPLQIWIWLGSRIWLIGTSCLLLKGCLQLHALHRALKGKTKKSEDERIYEVDFQTPFVMGLFRPHIYLPAGLLGAEREYILLHEKLHIQRGDHVFRFLGYLALCLHWFNPLVWLAYHVSGTDMEMSCDEAVIRKMGAHVKSHYSTSLLSLSAGSHGSFRMPLAFGEGNVKSRIQNILKYKKPALLTMCIFAGLCGAVVFLLAANPGENTKAGSGGQMEGPQEGKESRAEVQTAEEPGAVTQAEETPHVYYGVVSFTESSITPLMVCIPGAGNVLIPDAGQIVPYPESGVEELETGDLVQITFPEESHVQIEAAYPASFTEDASRIEVMGKGFLLFQREDATCYLGIPLAFVPNVRETDVFLDIYHEGSQDGNTGEELLARTCIDYMDESENLLRFALSDEDTRIFLAEYGFGIRCAGIPLHQEDLADGIYPIVIRTMDPETRAINTYIWSTSGTYLDVENGASPLKLSEHCRFTVNKGMARPNYQEVAYEEFVRIIEEGNSSWLNKPAYVKLQGGAIVGLTMDSEWYAYGISPVVQDQENPYADMTEQTRNEELVDLLDTYYTLIYTQEADVSDTPGMERLEIYRGNVGDGESGFLLVRGADDSVLHSRFLHAARAGWGSLYLCQDPEKSESVLVEIHKEDRGDYGEYRYCAYRLDTRGVTVTREGSSFEWGDSYIYREDLREKWMSGMNYYEENGQLLISCDENGFNP